MTAPVWLEDANMKSAGRSGAERLRTRALLAWNRFFRSVGTSMSRAQNIHVLLVAILGRHDAVHCNRCGDAAMAGWLIQLLLLPTFLGDPPSWGKKNPAVSSRVIAATSGERATSRADWRAQA